MMSSSHNSSYRRGLTLVEMMLALTIIALVMVGIQSAVLIAGRSVPDGKTGSSAALNAGRAVQLLSFDLAEATSFSKTNANEIEFLVPDRHGNGWPERIRYVWSGTSGGSLVHEYSRGTGSNQFAAAVQSVVLEDVRAFALAYQTRQEERPRTTTESAEMTLFVYDPLLSLADWDVASAKWIGQYFKPTLPSNAVSWHITRVMFKAKIRGAANGETRVQIRQVSGTVPSSTVLDEVSMFESDLSLLYAWQQFSFVNARDLNPAYGACLVLQWANDSDACSVQYQNLSATAPEGHVVTTTNSGSTWTVQLTWDMPLYVHGTVTTLDPPTYRDLLQAVRCTLQSGPDAQGLMEATIRVNNEPALN